MSTIINNKSESSNGLAAELLRIAKADFEIDRRSEQRFPFFHPISVRVGDRSLSAFTREVGASGMGLLHEMELARQEVTVTIPDRPQNLQLRIEWCESIGAGWFISGGSYVGATA